MSAFSAVRTSPQRKRPRDGRFRIALMPSSYAPAVGGVEVLTARLADRLRAHGHVVEVWAPSDPVAGLLAQEVIDGTMVRRFRYPMPQANLPSLLAFPARATRALAELRSAARVFSPTHLHVQCFSGNGAYATALSRLLGIPLVVTLQGETVMDDYDIYERSTTLRAALRWGLRRAEHVTGCSQFTLDDSITRFGLRATKSSVVFNGVDLDEAAPAPVAVPFRRYVLVLGRVVRNKGFDLLLNAFAGIAPRHPDLGLVIAGDGPELPRLQEGVTRLGLEQKVHFAGRLDRASVTWVMAHTEVFVMPSRVEPFGIVALEGWRAGVPVIVSARGGAPEFIQHDETGLVADPFDAEDLGRNLERVLSEPQTGQRLVAGARASLSAFTWEKLAVQYEDVYRGMGLWPEAGRAGESA